MILGLIFGSIIGGYVSDRFGRKKTLFFPLLFIIPTVFAGGYATNYITYCILRLISFELEC